MKIKINDAPLSGNQPVGSTPGLSLIPSVVSSAEIAVDHRTILELIPANSRVIDLGCGEGDLLDLLIRHKKVRAKGIDLNGKSVQACLHRGLDVKRGDFQSELPGYPNASFEYVILNQSLQQVARLDQVIQEALRVGVHVIIGFPNFGYWYAGWQLIVQGRAPMTPSLPYAWYDTPNCRFFTVRDFEAYCEAHRIHVNRRILLGVRGRIWGPRWRATSAIFVLSRPREAVSSVPSRAPGKSAVHD